MLKEIAEFTAKVYTTSDKKKLKNGVKKYRYGTISIRDPLLNEYVGQTVTVKAFVADEKDVEKE
jgi:hypothetical protein